MNASNYKHTHSAHCESGVVSSLLRCNGLELSEAMVFGLTSALTFAYLPFIKIGDMPLISYRSVPRAIIKKIQKVLGIQMKLEKFSGKQAGENRLDELLAEGKIVGCQASVYWLPYFPPEMQFHFNAHNFVIVENLGQEYLVSDPVFETTLKCERNALTKARFTKGLMAPKGLLYYPVSIPEKVDLKPALKKSIHKTAKSMLKTPVPVAGLRAMKTLSKAILKLKTKDRKYAKLFLGHIVRTQEEIGTGGAGFRYLYASFLQEASDLFDGNEVLNEAADMLLKVGDQWRVFALMIAKAIKSKDPIDFESIAAKLIANSEQEAAVYKKMLEFS